MTKPYPCIESTLEFPYKDKLIRLWINQTEVKNKYPEDTVIADKLLQVLNKGYPDVGFKEAVEYLAKEHKNVNAVQIKDRESVEQDGVVVYLVDFSSDVHG